ncbi:hypothetical protein QQ045_032216 [Rhodiola kirilowii]
MFGVIGPKHIGLKGLIGGRMIALPIVPGCCADWLIVKTSVGIAKVADGRLVWKGEGKGFTVEDTYRTLKARRGEVDWYKLTWNLFNTPRASLDAVLVARDRLLTKSRVRNMTMNVDPFCVLCKEEEETRDHLFFQYSTSRAICGKVLNFLGVPRVPVQCHLLIPWFKSLNQGHIRTRMIVAAITRAMYEIWGARNNIIFRGKSIDMDGIIRSIIWGLKVKIGGLNSNNSKLQDMYWLNSLRMC